MTPLHYAAMRGHTAVVEALIAAGADLEAVTVRCCAMFSVRFISCCHCVVVFARLNAILRARQLYV